VRRRSDSGGSDLHLAGVLDAGEVTVPRGYRRLAGMTVVENVPAKEAREVLEMLGIGVCPLIREQGEPIV
jgi:hypothetical protein